MPSPFPGMNPYLENEDVWQDFHDSMIPAMRDGLIAQIGPDYIIKIEHHLYIHELPADERYFLGIADIGISKSETSENRATATAAILSPQIGTLPSIEIEKQLFLEIRDKGKRELITVIELLSPTNKKHGPDREQYLAKRGMILQSRTNLVEIDLLRGWERMPLDEVSESDYCVVVSRAEDRPRFNYWPIGLREPLPVVPIPLRIDDANVMLDLQSILHEVYDRAGYGRRIYTEMPMPHLCLEDAAWAAALIGSR